VKRLRGMEFLEFLQRLSRLGDPVLVNSGFSLKEYSSTEEARKRIDDFF